ncbi:hypothetical protein [Kribbella sp. NPDC050459]|uniref:hypothetical protein n=1 Tax=Kribbella sp. NPDC050459 TaxID=3155785 RepID=UPI00340202D3
MKLSGWRRWLKQASAGGEAEAATGENPAPAGQPGPPTAVQAEALKQMSTAVTWLIGALAAVAAAMIAGSQLSSIGRLSWSEDRDRLVIAVLSISVAIGLILLAIGLLYRAQAPTNTDFTRLRKLAESSKLNRLETELRRQVADDSTLHRGRGDLASLMQSFDEVRKQFHGLKDTCYETQLEIVRATDAETRAAKQTQLTRLEQEREVIGGRMTDYRTALVRVAQLDKYLRTRARTRRTAWAVMGLSVLAAFAFVSFAWAANPPDEPKDAVAQRIVAAHLVVSTKGKDELEPQLGSACASAAAGAGGIPVLAVSSTDSGIEVILIPTSACSYPHRVVVSRGDGEVTADNAVLATSPTPSTSR